MTDDYRDFFALATDGFTPYPYQERLAETPWAEWPAILDIPTGLGKTAAVVLGWLWRRRQKPDQTPRRLVYTLPMRSLVTQTVDETRKWLDNLDNWEADDVHVLMGGSTETDWTQYPGDEAIIVGTQDMLVSRALMRGYGMSRYEWPVHYGLLHNDAFWVFDETQLMGVAVETSAQLEAFRNTLGTAAPSGSLWMSATVVEDQLDTVDHPEPDEGWEREQLDTEDRNKPSVDKKLHASKELECTEAELPNSTATNRLNKYARDLADEILEAHVSQELTLVVINRVERAQTIYEEVTDRADDEHEVVLLHSRFRAPDRESNEKVFDRDGDRIVVATQVVEAGLDVSARVMFTELAPWPSLVQRFGRCHRYGDFETGEIYWINAEDGEKAARPYASHQLQTAREILRDFDDAKPAELQTVDFSPQPEVRPVLRRKDLLELFDTSSDLSGNDVDVSKYVRQTEDNDVLVYWRAWDGEQPPDDAGMPDDTETCRVPSGTFRDFLDDAGKVDAWRWDALDGVWVRAESILPGRTYLLSTEAGGYSHEFGWTGSTNERVSPLADADTGAPPESLDDDDTEVGDWIPLEAHLEHVADHVEMLADNLQLDGNTTDVLDEAARWHDVGKAHPAFQRLLLLPTLDDDGPDGPAERGLWAKSSHRRGQFDRRPRFRHELASALAYRQASEDTDQTTRDVVSFLIAAHHGKVRLTIQSLPGEREPSEDQTDRPDLFARGVWHGDRIPDTESLADGPDLSGGPIRVPEEGEVGPFVMDLTPMQLGEGSWLERMLELRDDRDIGPFRLGWLEALLRIADRCASEEERKATDAGPATTDDS